MLKEITVTKIEPKTTAEKKPYRVVTGGDGTQYNIWDGKVQVEEGKAYECEVIPNSNPDYRATIKHADISSNGHDAKALAAEMAEASAPQTVTELRLELLAHAIHHVGDKNLSVVETARAFEKYVTAG